MRIITVSACAIAGLAILLVTAGSNAAPGNHRVGRLPRVTTPPVCASNAPVSFVGVPHVGNVAGGGTENGVLAGNSNQACGDSSALGAGQQNIMDLDAQDAFLGAGYRNRLGDFNHDLFGSFSFLGAGVFNDVTGEASFVGAGGTEFGTKQPANTSAFNDQVSGDDSFVGAGDLNSVSGFGSFIGAGGYALASTGSVGPGNQIGADDAFIGAGNLNDVAAPESFVGAGNANVVQAGGNDSAIAGGSNNQTANQFDIIGGGQSNGVNAVYGTLGGGSANAISQIDGSTVEANGASYAAIVGGSQNLIQATAANGAQYAFIGGGESNEVTAQFGAIAGGDGNVVTGYLAAIPGGYRNAASGSFSFAAGYASHATTSGSFVWSDYSPTASHLTPVRANQFLARATGGVTFYSNAAQTTGVTLAPGAGAWSNASDRNLKTAFARIDDGAILAKVDALPVGEWSYRSERDVRHLGPMAQDFRAAFGVGEDDRHISTLDEEGVALAAIKGLDAKLARRDAELAALRAEVRALAAAFAAAERRNR